MTEERARTMTAAVLDVYPDMAGSAELQEAEAELRTRIDNKELRTYHVQFKGGSTRVLQPNTEHKVFIDLDREGGQLSYLFKRLDGVEQIIEVKA